MKSKVNTDVVAAHARLGEAIVTLVKESGLARPARRKRRLGRRKKAAAKSAPRARRPRVTANGAAEPAPTANE